VGLTDEQIVAVKDWVNHAHLFTDDEIAVLAYTDDLLAHRMPTATTIEMLTAHFAPSTQVALTMLIGFYDMTATFLMAMAVELEASFIGWELASAHSDET
jgi:alkylhydroperoxidase family enzyme